MADATLLGNFLGGISGSLASVGIPNLDNVIRDTSNQYLGSNTTNLISQYSGGLLDGLFSKVASGIGLQQPAAQYPQVPVQNNNPNIFSGLTIPWLPILLGIGVILLIFFLR